MAVEVVVEVFVEVMTAALYARMLWLLSKCTSSMGCAREGSRSQPRVSRFGGVGGEVFACSCWYAVVVVCSEHL